ncbi:accessory gland protein Acp63F-like [Drosophila santomea]|uniref:accessory gland protein Acp63F-like n=1 Tax=Drosophila santomea TaxID=129105 RepID=UPI0019542BDE|nr:accessory gland protein Acp63F-like [Drosophila santomea]
MQPILVFILVMLTVQIESKCSTLVTLKLDPHCGMFSDCVVNGANPSVLTNISCRRIEKGKSGLINMKLGKCNPKVPRCSFE